MSKSRFILVLPAIFVGLSAQAESDAAYDPQSGLLHIPKVIVDGKEYWANLVHQGNLIFSVTQAELISSYPTLVGSWRIPSGGVLTFSSDGSYHVTEYGDGDGCFDGVETGTYKYTPERNNQVVHEIAVTSVTSDENGDCGLACNGIPCPPAAMWVKNNILHIDEIGGAGAKFPRLE